MNLLQYVILWGCLLTILIFIFLLFKHFRKAQKKILLLIDKIESLSGQGIINRDNDPFDLCVVIKVKNPVDVAKKRSRIAKIISASAPNLITKKAYD